MRTVERDVVKKYFPCRLREILIGIAILAPGFSLLRAQESATRQTLVLRVAELSKIHLVGSSFILQVGGNNGRAPVSNSLVDGKTKLLWMSNGEESKITVTTDSFSPRFILRLEAESISPGAGLAAPEVTLRENRPYDLILGVSRSAGSCTLKLTAVETVNATTGAESHRVTYTITGV